MGGNFCLCMPGNLAHPVVPFLVAGFVAISAPSFLSRMSSCITDRNIVHWFLSRKAFFMALTQGYLHVCT